MLALAVLLAPSLAHAYRRSTTTSDPAVPLFWSRREHSFSLAAHTSPVPDAELRAAIGRSFRTWSEVGCTDVRVALGADTRAVRTNFDGGMHDGESLLVFRDAWPIELSETLAITTVVFRPTTGEILDADVDFDAEYHTWSALDPPTGDDVENTLTHELGHYLGFAHVGDVEATMFYYAGAAETLKRDLSADDERAVCEVYPRGAATPVQRGSRPALTNGCAIGAGSTSLGGALLALAAVWLLASRRVPR